MNLNLYLPYLHFDSLSAAIDTYQTLATYVTRFGQLADYIFADKTGHHVLSLNDLTGHPKLIGAAKTPDTTYLMGTYSAPIYNAQTKVRIGALSITVFLKDTRLIPIEKLLGVRIVLGYR